MSIRADEHHALCRAEKSSQHELFICCAAKGETDVTQMLFLSLMLRYLRPNQPDSGF